MRESDFENDEWCARCERYIANARETGVSSLYNPGPKSILLCAPCYEDEDDEIEQKGTNNLPDRLASYRRVLAQH